MEETGTSVGSLVTLTYSELAYPNYLFFIVVEILAVLLFLWIYALLDASA
jgi:hypothetical protein